MFRRFSNLKTCTDSKRLENMYDGMRMTMLLDEAPLGFQKSGLRSLQVSSTEVPDINSETQQDVLRNSVAPLWNVSYNEQLAMKDNHISHSVTQCLSSCKQRLSKNRVKRTFDPHRPKIRRILPSPVLHQYRSTDVYMVRPGLDGEPKTVGQIVGKISLGNYVCVPPIDTLSPPRHIEIAKFFQDYIRSSSLPACENYSKGGNWNSIKVRSNSEGETMAVVEMHPQLLTQAQIEEECEKLREYFESGPGSICQLSSLYFLASQNANESVPYQLLYGNKYIMEKLRGYDLAISPGSFFHCNRQMAEIMYHEILRAANLSSGTSLLDLGCGPGTISILAKQYVRGTIGIDMSEEAIQVAKFNASLNNDTSTNFITGTIKMILRSALAYFEQSSDIAVILNLGKCGVEKSVIELLRETPQIGKIIYVAPRLDHRDMVQNVLDIIKPKSAQ